MVRANLIQNAVSVNMYGYNEEIGIGDYVIIVTENKEKSKFNTVAKVVDYNDKFILFDNSTSFESRVFKIYYSNMVDIYKITKERARMLLRFRKNKKMY